MGLERWIGVSWVRWLHGLGSELGFGFWIWDRRGLAEIKDCGDFFFLAWFDGPMGGARICGGDCVLVVVWWLWG